MARMYKEQNPDVTLKRAIHEALKAYELYKESEIEQMDKEYERRFRRYTV